MEIGLLLLFMGACCIRQARSQGEADTGECLRQPEKPGWWQRLMGICKPSPELTGSREEESLEIHQEMDKKTKRTVTTISYRGYGRTASLQLQENMTLEFAGFAFKLEPSGVKVQEVSQKAGGEVISFPIEQDGNSRGVQTRPGRDQRVKTGNRGRRQEAGEAGGDNWSF